MKILAVLVGLLAGVLISFMLFAQPDVRPERPPWVEEENWIQVADSVGIAVSRAGPIADQPQMVEGLLFVYLEGEWTALMQPERAPRARVFPLPQQGPPKR